MENENAIPALTPEQRDKLYGGYHVEVCIFDVDNDLARGNRGKGTGGWTLWSQFRPRTLEALKSVVLQEFGQLPDWLATLDDPTEYIGVEADEMEHPQFPGAYALLDVEGAEVNAEG